MNNLERQKRKWSLLNYFRPLTKVNVFNENLHNSWQHEKYKFAIYFTLRKQGYDVITEGEFLNKKRCDIYCIDTNTCIEVLCSETKEECLEKCKCYPQEFRLVMNKAQETFNEKDIL